jgi:hypothetical protein
MRETIQHPIVHSLSKRVKKGRDGQYSLSEEDASIIAAELLACDDETLRGAVIALVCVSEIVHKELGAPDIGERLLDIAELAGERLRRTGAAKDTRLESLKRRTAARTGGEATVKRAPMEGARPEPGTISLKSLLPPRSIR